MELINNTYRCFKHIFLKTHSFLNIITTKDRIIMNTHIYKLKNNWNPLSLHQRMFNGIAILIRHIMLSFLQR